VPTCGRPEARCACGERRFVETRLPACATCPPGERLAEAVLGGAVTDIRPASGQGAGAYELKPEDDGRDDV